MDVNMKIAEKMFYKKEPLKENNEAKKCEYENRINKQYSEINKRIYLMNEQIELIKKDNEKTARTFDITFEGWREKYNYEPIKK